jgi:hypothetical protein
MGLDMYLATDNGVDSSEIGYWRKHPDLHGYIVNNFANGVDECQQINLSSDDIIKIIDAVRSDSLCHNTTGFFFGVSSRDESQKVNDIEIFEKALMVMKSSSNYSRIYYQASW